MGLLRRAVGSPWEAAALLAVLFAMGWVVQGPSNNANSHQLLVRALATGTPIVDDVRGDVGELNTTDVAVFDGHFYSDKAPGLAFVALPGYLLLEAFGKTDDPIVVLWWIGLFALVLPAAALLILVRTLVEGLQPGLGTPTAIVIGLGTLILPFSTLFFAHVLSATLAFAAFAALWWEREGGPRLALVALAGVLAALAASTEHATALVGLILFPYAVSRSGPLRRGAAYLAGGLMGAVPLLVYDWWAFDSPFRFPYTYGVHVPGESRIDVLNNEVPLSELWDVPTIDDVTGLLFTTWGLVTAAPMLALAAVGGYRLWTRGRRWEAAIGGAVLVAFVLYSAAYYEPFGDTWAPRFLVPVIPFLALPVAAAFAALPGVGAALAGASIALTAAVTITNPLSAWDGHVLDRLFSADLASHSRTVVDVLGVVAWWDTIPYFVAVAFAGGYALRAIVRAAGPVRSADALAAVVAVGGWALFAQMTPRLVDELREVAHARSLVLLTALAAVVAAVAGAELAAGRRQQAL
jgi:hypothetical protein